MQFQFPGFRSIKRNRVRWYIKSTKISLSVTTRPNIPPSLDTEVAKYNCRSALLLIN